MNKIVWCNGTFDILHPGHIKLFKVGKSLGDKLIVATDTDEKIRQDKGASKPVNNLCHRVSMLQAIKYIDEVIPFGSAEELESLIKDLKPEVMVIGSDWKGKKVIGQQYAKELIFFDRIGDYSTTKILENK